MDIKQYDQLKKTMIKSMYELSKIEDATPDPTILVRLNFSFPEGRKSIRSLYVAKSELCKEIVSCLDSIINIEDAILKIGDNKQKRLMELKYIDGFTLEQAAEKMGISSRHAQRIHRDALEKLKNTKIM